MWIQVKYSENESFYIETPSNTKISELTQTILRYFNLKNQLIQLFTLAIEHAQQHKKDQNYYQPLWKLYELYLSDEVLHEPVNVNAFSEDIEKIKTNDLFNELVKSEAPQSAISKCELFFVKKKLESDKMLSDYAGKIEKTKIIISIDESTMSKIQSVPSNINLVIPPSILKPNKKRKADELNESFFAKRSKPNKQEELPQKSLRVPESDILTESILSLIGKRVL